MPWPHGKRAASTQDEVLAGGSWQTAAGADVVRTVGDATAQVAQVTPRLPLPPAHQPEKQLQGNEQQLRCLERKAWVAQPLLGQLLE